MTFVGTKRLLFPAEGQRVALDTFFRLAQARAEPDPSGTAGVLTAGGVNATELVLGVPFRIAAAGAQPHAGPRDARGPWARAPEERNAASAARADGVQGGFSASALRMLPDSAIVVVHRADGSGTTFNFADYLSKFSPEWKAGWAPRCIALPKSSILASSTIVPRGIANDVIGITTC